MPSPGDVLRYQITIQNSGGAAATGVVFRDIPDSATTLVAGAVTTSQGAIVSGNGGTPPVVVNVGTIAPSGTVTITFDVTIDPLPPGVTSVVESGHGRERHAPDRCSPTTRRWAAAAIPPSPSSPRRARLRAEKTATLGSDNDFDGVPSPGDRLDYHVVIVNAGNAAATGVVFDDAPDPNTALVTGSVTTTQGVGDHRQRGRAISPSA